MRGLTPEMSFDKLNKIYKYVFKAFLLILLSVLAMFIFEKPLTKREVQNCLNKKPVSLNDLQKFLCRQNYPYAVDQIAPDDWSNFILTTNQKELILRKNFVKWYDEHSKRNVFYFVTISTRSPEQYWTGGAGSGFDGYTILLDKSYAIVGYFDELLK